MKGKIKEVKELLKKPLKKTIKKTKVETFNSFNEALQQIRKETKNHKEKPQRIIKRKKSNENN